MNSIKKTKENKATEFIRHYLSDGHLSEGSKLPPIAQLARSAHVGTQTMCDAIAILVDKKELVVIGTKGVFYKTAPVIAPKPSTGSKWHRIRAFLEEEILNGDYDVSGVLPSTGDLKRKFGSSFYTIRTAIDSMITDDLLEERERKFHIKTASKENPFSSILFIAPGTPGTGLMFYNNRIIDCYNGLMTQQKIKNLAIAIQPVFGKMDDTETESILCSIEQSRHDNIGFIIWSEYLGKEMIHQILIRVATTAKPVAIMDEQGDFVLPENLRTNRNIKIFSIASIKAGHVVGRMLLNAGHRNIAYLSIGADQPWSARRFNGLKKTFENIDNSAGIHLVSGNNSLPVEPQIKRNIQSIEDFVQLYESLWKKNLPSLNLAAYTMQLQTLLSQEYAYTQLVPLLQRALELRSTAWVFENDQLAGLALTNFIRQNNISVPDNLAVVGFDDTAVAANINLTSYNFDFGGIARTAISFILNPEHRIYWNKTRIECEGLVIERNSTRGHYSPIT